MSLLWRGVASLPSGVACRRLVLRPLGPSLRTVTRAPWAVRASSSFQEAESVSPDEFAREAAREDHDKKPTSKSVEDPFAKAILRDLTGAREKITILKAASRQQPPVSRLTKHTASLISKEETKSSPPSVQKAARKPIDPATFPTNHPQRLLVLRGIPPWVESRGIIAALKDISPAEFPRRHNPFRLAKCEVHRSPSQHSATAFLEFYDAHGAEVVRNRVCNGERILGFSPSDAILHDVAHLPALLRDYEYKIEMAQRPSVVKPFFNRRLPLGGSPTTNASENGGASQITDPQDIATADRAQQTEESPQVEASDNTQRAKGTPI